VAYSEGQIGWIPYVLERADTVWQENRGWGGIAEKVLRPPSELFREHMYGCFFDDAHGLRSYEEIGVDNITFETDYPHSDSTWPNTVKLAAEQTAGLPDDVVYKVMRGNAITMLGLDPD
jgi:predicted TIM-barrel fold metal-dependent hydrolase